MKTAMNSAEIQIGKWGRILLGQEAGWYVFVQDDSISTGGFLILTAPEPASKKGFDNWAENMEGVEKYFHFAGWKIEWL